MQAYWKCEECDEVNKYPQVKECETCGNYITPQAEETAKKYEDEISIINDLNDESEDEKEVEENNNDLRKNNTIKPKKNKKLDNNKEEKDRNLIIHTRTKANKLKKKEIIFANKYTSFLAISATITRLAMWGAIIFSVVIFIINFNRIDILNIHLFENITNNILFLSENFNPIDNVVNLIKNVTGGG